MEIYVQRRVSSTAMHVQFSLGVVPTNVNRIAVTALHHIMKPLLLTNGIFSLIIVFMFDVLIVYCNDYSIG